MPGYSYPSRPYSPPPPRYPPRNGNNNGPRAPYPPPGGPKPYQEPYRPYSPPRDGYRRDGPAYNPPPSAAYDYDPYGPNHAYSQPTQPYDGGYGGPAQDQYDPYNPVTSDHAVPAYRPYSPPPLRRSPPRRNAPRSPIRRAPPPRDRGLERESRPPQSRAYHAQPPPERLAVTGPVEETYLLTPPTWSIIAGAMTYIHQLPSSHLPLAKYVATSKTEAAALHKRILSRANASFWYTDGSLRGGECWSAAIEWNVKQESSGKKMRECVGEGDALDAELGGMRKAGQAFIEDLPNTHPQHSELIIFSDSQAAIVSLDTSTRPESRKFCELYEGALQRFPSISITLVWIPGHYGIEGNELADKIAVVGATNSYLKRKKQGALKSFHVSGPASETLPGASMRPGHWQSGSADPEAVFQPESVPPPPPQALLPGGHAGAADPYPELPPISPHQPVVPPMAESVSPLAMPLGGPMAEMVQEPSAPQEQSAEGPPEDDQLEAKEGSLFVTNFPEHATARDIGILFGQFGSIVAVDIFSIPPITPRFALVTFTDPPKSSPAAIAVLDRKPIPFDNEWAESHRGDIQAWENWNGTLVVVLSEGGSLVPKMVAPMFPDLPEWAIGGGKAVTNAPTLEVSAKRDRDVEDDETPPSKRLREVSETSDEDVEQLPQVKVEEDKPPMDVVAAASPPKVEASPAKVAASPAKSDAELAAAVVETSPMKTSQVLPPFPPSLATNVMPPFPPKALPPFPPSLSATTQTTMLPPTPSSAGAVAQIQPSAATSISPSSIEDLAAAQPILAELKLVATIRREEIVRIQQMLTRFAPTNWVGQVNYLAQQFDLTRVELGATITAAEQGRQDILRYEASLADRGFSRERIETFVKKVLALLDGIAQEDADPETSALTNTSQTDLPTALQLIESLQHTCASLQTQLDDFTSSLSDKTRHMIAPLETLYESVNEALVESGKERDEVQRRALVLEGMLSRGEVVGAVVGFLLSK